MTRKIAGAIAIIASLLLPAAAFPKDDAGAAPPKPAAAAEPANGAGDRKPDGEKGPEEAPTEPDPAVEDPLKDEEPAPIPAPKKGGILAEVSLKKELGKKDSSMLVFRDPRECFGNAAFAMDLPKDGTPASRTVLAETQCPFFLKIDMSERPANAMLSADEKINAAVGFISSLPGLRHRIKGVLLKSSADSKDSQWKGHEEELYAYMAMISRGIKKYDKTIMVGGPGLSSAFEGEGRYKSPAPLLKGYLDYAERLKVPLDIVYLDNGGLMPYTHFLEPAFVKSRILPEYKELSKAKVYSSVRDGIPGDESPADAKSFALQNVMCAVKSNADFIELPLCISGEAADYAIRKPLGDGNAMTYDAQGLDRLSFIVQASMEGDDTLWIVAAATNPSKTVTSMADGDLKKAMEEEYRTIVHKFTDGIFSPDYSRFRLSITGCKWRGKEILMERFVMDDDGSIVKAEEQKIPGRSEFFFNKSVKTPSIVVIKLTAREPEPEAESKPAQEGRNEPGAKANPEPSGPNGAGADNGESQDSEYYKVEQGDDDVKTGPDEKKK